MKTVLKVMLGIVLGCAITPPSPAVAADPPATTLTIAEAAPLVKRAVRVNYSDPQAYRRTGCARRSRLRVTCKVRWRASLDERLAATVDIVRTGTAFDDREQYRVVVRSSSSRTQRYAGDFLEETRRSAVGRPLTLIGQGGDRLRVTPAGPVPVITNEFDTPPAGTQYVAFPLTIVNVGAGRYQDSLTNGAKLVTQEGRTIDPATVITGDCSEGRVDVPAGETRLACLAFAVPDGVVVRVLELALDSGYGPETGEWSLP